MILPDSSELQLPDGATGLDAARAIGPKLAEQAVLVRSNGSVRDLRLPRDAALVTILRGGRVIVPQPDEPLEPGDELLFVASTEVEDQVRDALR